MIDAIGYHLRTGSVAELSSICKMGVWWKQLYLNKNGSLYIWIYMICYNVLESYPYSAHKLMKDLYEGP